VGYIFNFGQAVVVKVKFIQSLIFLQTTDFLEVVRSNLLFISPTIKNPTKTSCFVAYDLPTFSLVSQIHSSFNSGQYSRFCMQSSVWPTITSLVRWGKYCKPTMDGKPEKNISRILMQGPLPSIWWYWMPLLVHLKTQPIKNNLKNTYNQTHTMLGLHAALMHEAQNIERTTRILKSLFVSPIVFRILFF